MSPPNPPTIRPAPRIVARNETDRNESEPPARVDDSQASIPPVRVDDRFDRQAEATIYSIAEDRRRLDALTKERNELYDANARMSAQLEVLREELRHREEEIVRRNILAESWHGEAMRLRSAGDIAVAAWMAATGQQNETDEEG
jgi:hypothetical protein